VSKSYTHTTYSTEGGYEIFYFFRSAVLNGLDKFLIGEFSNFAMEFFRVGVFVWFFLLFCFWFFVCGDGSYVGLGLGFFVRSVLEALWVGVIVRELLFSFWVILRKPVAQE
jgi:hypothetical protein